MPVAATAATAATLVLLTAAPASADTVNQSPVAVDDVVSLRSMAAPQTVWAVSNDSDPDGDALSYSAVTPAANGRAYISNGWLYYQPHLGSTAGTDSFTYTVSDGHGHTATATVSVTTWDDPGVPSGVTISSDAPGSVTLTWAATPGAVRYRVHGDGGVVSTTTDPTWTETGLTDTTSHRWYIGAVNAGGFEGSWSTGVTRAARLSTPTSLTAVVTGNPTTLALDWDGAPAGAWNVYRDGVLLAGTTVSEFEDTGLVTGHEYSYQVQDVFSGSAGTIYPPSLLSAAVRGTPAVLSPIARFLLDGGAGASELGAVTVPERAVPGGYQQDHQNGLVLQQDGEDAHAVLWTSASFYTAAGGVTGVLGFPIGDRECGLRDHGCAQFFEGGSLWEHGVMQAWVVQALIEESWAAAGWEDGPLGYPVADQVPLRGGVGQAFEGGAVYWTAATGAHAVHGPIRSRWAAAGFENGALGWPTSDEVEGPGGRWRQSFQGGTITWTQSGGARVVVGAIRDTWTRLGAETGRLGLPLTDEIPLRGGRGQVFEGGTVYWTPTTGVHVVTGAIRDAWGRSGWENGPLGYPLTDELALRGGRYQLFQGGSVYWSPGNGAHVVLGAIRGAWAGQGWETGRLGYPTTDEIPLRGGAYQLFQGGSVYWSPTTGAHAVLGLIRDAWARQGWETGRLGYPITDEYVFAGASAAQTFQGGKIWVDLRTGVVTYR